MGGENYGWRLREGTTPSPKTGVGGPAPPGAIEPIFDYPHFPAIEPCPDPGTGFSGFAVTGGYVYRGPVAALEQQDRVLQNVRKHARASLVVVSSAVVDDDWTLEIRDDGRGFDPSQPRTGFGISAAILEPMREVGGRVDIGQHAVVVTSDSRYLGEVLPQP